MAESEVQDAILAAAGDSTVSSEAAAPAESAASTPAESAPAADSTAAEKARLPPARPLRRAPPRKANRRNKTPPRLQGACNARNRGGSAFMRDHFRSNRTTTSRYHK